MAGKTYRLRLVRGDQQFEAEGDKGFVLKMLDRFEGSAAEPRPSLTSEKAGRATSKQNYAASKQAKEFSIGEFIRRFSFKKHMDLVLGFGYYLEQHSGLTSFTAADINNCYYEAKMESSNTSQMLIQNIRRGYVMQAKGDKGAKRRYTITRTGEDYLKRALEKPKAE